MNEIQTIHQFVMHELALQRIPNTVLFTTEYPKLFDPNPRWFLSIKQDDLDIILEWEPTDDFGDSRFTLSLSQNDPIYVYHTIPDTVKAILDLLSGSNPKETT